MYLFLQIGQFILLKLNDFSIQSVWNACPQDNVVQDFDFISHKHIGQFLYKYENSGCSNTIG